MMSKWGSFLFSLACVAGCLGSAAHSPAHYSSPAAVGGPSGSSGLAALEFASCAVSARHQLDGRVLVHGWCRLVTSLPAQHRSNARYLRQLVPAGRGGSTADVTDDAIRLTAEFRAYMNPTLRWQWRDHVTDAEALTACRLMLADMNAGRPVYWQSQAREYITRARQRRRQAVDGKRVQGKGRVHVPVGDRRPVGKTSLPGRPRPPQRIQKTGEAGDSRRRSVDIRQVLDKIRQRRRTKRVHRRKGHRGGRSNRLDSLLQKTEIQLGALTTILAGTTITIILTTVGGELIEYTIVAEGAVPDDPALVTRISTPLFEELSKNLQEIERLTSGGGPTLSDPTALKGRLSQAERLSYRDLLRKPLAGLDRDDFERIETLRRKGNLADPLRPGSATHKAARWADYQTRQGKWPFRRWSKTYDQNMVRARLAHNDADRLWKSIGWGQRELAVKVGNEKRVLDIGDAVDLRGVEVKRGYVTLNAEIASEVRRDAILVTDRGWSMTWHVNGRCSEPLRKTLRAARIKLRETHSTTMIKDLYNDNQR